MVMGNRGGKPPLGTASHLVERYNYTVSVVIEAGQQVSGIASLEGCAIVGLKVPVIDSSAITFQVADSLDGPFVVLKSKDGTLVSITAGTGDCAISSDDLTPLAAYPFVKLVCAPQTADREFTFLLKA